MSNVAPLKIAIPILFLFVFVLSIYLVRLGVLLPVKDEGFVAGEHDVRILHVMPNSNSDSNERRIYIDLDDMPDEVVHLVQLLHSLVMVSFPVEVWRQPHVPDSGAAVTVVLRSLRDDCPTG